MIAELFAEPGIGWVRLSFPGFWIDVGGVHLGCWVGIGGCTTVRVELNFEFLFFFFSDLLFFFVCLVWMIL